MWPAAAAVGSWPSVPRHSAARWNRTREPSWRHTVLCMCAPSRGRGPLVWYRPGRCANPQVCHRLLFVVTGEAFVHNGLLPHAWLSCPLFSV